MRMAARVCYMMFPCCVLRLLVSKPRRRLQRRPQWFQLQQHIKTPQTRKPLRRQTLQGISSSHFPLCGCSACVS